MFKLFVHSNGVLKTLLKDSGHHDTQCISHTFFHTSIFHKRNLNSFQLLHHNEYSAVIVTTVDTDSTPYDQTTIHGWGKQHRLEAWFVWLRGACSHNFTPLIKLCKRCQSASSLDISNIYSHSYSIYTTGLKYLHASNRGLQSQPDVHQLQFSLSRHQLPLNCTAELHAQCI